jgi:hypothetical protein
MKLKFSRRYQAGLQACLIHDTADLTRCAIIEGSVQLTIV